MMLLEGGSGCQALPFEPGLANVIAHLGMYRRAVAAYDVPEGR